MSRRPPLAPILKRIERSIFVLILMHLLVIVGILDLLLAR